MIWLPVESDSEIITKYAHKLGLREKFEFIELYSFDSETAVEFGIPVDQCKGMILLFPLPEDDESAETDFPVSLGPAFFKQTIENSCCLVALLHILLNNHLELLNLAATPETIKTLLNVGSGDTATDLIEKSEELKEIHEEMAQSGGSQVPELSENVPFHFVAIIPSPSGVYLMDGRRSGPIEFKKCEEEESSFFGRACRVAKEEFVEKSADQTNFAAIILI